MAVQVHLVDGTFELFRCFHGAPRHVNAKGEEVGAVRGLLHTLLSLLKADDSSHVAVAFDALPAVRGPVKDEPGILIRRQAPLAMDAVRALGIPVWPMVRFQADDALATGARVLSEDAAVTRVLLCTSDTDLFQCIRGERVVVLNRITKTITDEAAFRDRYGVVPSQLPDYLALVGAPAKGLPGVPRWGKTDSERHARTLRGDRADTRGSGGLGTRGRRQGPAGRGTPRPPRRSAAREAPRNPERRPADRLFAEFTGVASLGRGAARECRCQD